MATTLKDEIKASLVGGYLPCSSALELAGKLKVVPKTIGDAADEMGVRIRDCQLGCFAVKKATHDDLDKASISDVMAEAVKGSLVNGSLPCAKAFKLRTELGVSLKEIGDTATMLKIKIVRCQLGCFP
ncbi:MAG: hypothetical protein AB1597_01420 [Chloroflexota bacterium]